MADIKVARLEDLPQGEMTEVEVGGLKLVLIRDDDRVTALGGECPHQGASLAEGLLLEDHVRCPWHQACFCRRNGNLLEPPAREGLATFEARVEDGDVIVSVPDGAGGTRSPDMANNDPAADGRTFVIVGAGAAGTAAAERLRGLGFEGRLLIVTREADLPYDRTELSKRYLSGEGVPEVGLREADYYADHGIELLTGRQVVGVHPVDRRIEFADGECLTYDACLLATGACPRPLDIEGADLEGVLTLRSLPDAGAIRDLAERGAGAVVVGAGFIGMEVASALAGRGTAVTVVAPESVRWSGLSARRSVRP